MKNQLIKLTGISADKQKFEEVVKELKAGFIFTLTGKKDCKKVKFWLATCYDVKVNELISQHSEIKFEIISAEKVKYVLSEFGAEFTTLNIEDVRSFVKSSDGIENGKFAFRLNPILNAKRGTSIFQLRDAIGCELSTGTHHGDDYLVVEASIAEFAVELMFEEGIYFECLTEGNQIPHNHRYMF